MKKVLFASLLTVVVVCAQAGGGTTDKKGAESTEKNGSATGGAGSGRTTKTKVLRKGPRKMSDFNESSHPTDKAGSAAANKLGGCHGRDTPTEESKETKLQSKKGPQEQGRHWAVTLKNAAERIAA